MQEATKDAEKQWQQRFPELITASSDAMNPNTDQNDIIRIKLNTVMLAYLAALNLLHSRNTLLARDSELDLKEQKAQQVSDKANSFAWQACRPVLAFVAEELEDSATQEKSAP